MEELSNFVFFRVIYDFIHSEIDEFAIHLLARTMALVSTVALSLLALWILIRGYRIVTGQSHQPMLGLVVDSLRTMLILGFACGLALDGSTLYEFLGSDLPNEISRVVTGSDTPVIEQIDRSMAVMQVALTSIDSLEVGHDPIVDKAKSRDLWFTGIGAAGPALSGGAMLLMNQIAMALFIGLGPLFVLSLLFEQTKGLFGRWLYYGIGTMFSLAVLSVMVTMALDMVLAVATAFWLSAPLAGNTEGITSLAMQQGGLGLILTVLILSAPPMAAQFFNGVLGSFNPKSVFEGGGNRALAWQGSDAGNALYTGGHNPEVTPVAPLAGIAFELGAESSNQDQIKTQSALGHSQTGATDGDSFLDRYPYALASNGWIGNGGDAPLFDRLTPIARNALPPSVDEALAGRNVSQEQEIAYNKALFDILLTDPSVRSEAEILRAQRLLREAGYTLVSYSTERNPAHPDGVGGRWNNETAGAMRAYREATSETITRRIDIANQITGNLQIPVNPRLEDSSTFIEIDGRRHDFIFTPASYANALDYGYSVQNSVQNVDVGTYLAAADGASRISDAGVGATFHVSSGWRPNVGAPKGHPKGNGLDLSGIEIAQNGTRASARFIDPGKRVGYDPSMPEPDLVRQYRESLYAIRHDAGVRQIFNPWQMLYSQEGQWRANHPRREGDNDWVHRHHIHIGIKGYPER